MDEVDYAVRLVELEQQELQSEDDPSDKLYAQLLALYILTNDLISAKFLWKRIPVAVKSENEDLQTIWRIAVNLIQRTPAPVYFLIQEHEWPAYVRTIMQRIVEQVRRQQISLIQHAYSDIRFENLKRLTGMTTDEEAMTLIQQLGWSLNPETQIVVPVKNTPDTQSPDSEKDLSQEQLHKLTEYVAFLEQQ